MYIVFFKFLINNFTVEIFIPFFLHYKTNLSKAITGIATLIMLLIR